MGPIIHKKEPFPWKSSFPLPGKELISPFNISVDGVHTFFEPFHFIRRELVLQHFLHAMDSDNRRHAAEYIMLTVLTGEFYRAGKNPFLIVENSPHQGGSSGSNAVLRTLFALAGHPAAFDGLFLNPVLIENKAGIPFHLGQGLAIEIHLGPGNHLGASMLTHHEGKESSGIKAGLVGNGMDKAGGIKQGSRPHHPAPGQSGQFGNEMGNHIAGIGNGHKNPIKSRFHHLRHIIRHLAHAVSQLIVPVFRGAEAHISHCVNNNIAVL